MNDLKKLGNNFNEEEKQVLKDQRNEALTQQELIERIRVKERRVQRSIKRTTRCENCNEPIWGDNPHIEGIKSF